MTAPDDSTIKTPPPKRSLYFINEKVEFYLLLYNWSGGVDVTLRDKIMENANELIRQVIRKHGLHVIYPGQEESSFGDLMTTAWLQLERTLYKFRAQPHCRTCYDNNRPNDSLLYEVGLNEYGIKRPEEIIKMHKGKCPHCKAALLPLPLQEGVQDCYGGTTTILYRGLSKIFNMWSQISRTVILAHVKKEGRDRKNAPAYAGHLGGRKRFAADAIKQFVKEAEELFKYNEDYLKLVRAMAKLVATDDRPHDGLAGKLIDTTGLSKSTVGNFLSLLKLNSHEFSMAPANRDAEDAKLDRRKNAAGNDEETPS
jgi:hypothetical protein